MTTHENFHRREYPFRSLLALVVTAIIFSAAVTSAQTYQKAAGRSMDEDARYHPIELLSDGSTIQVGTETNLDRDIIVIRRAANGTIMTGFPVHLGRIGTDEDGYDVVESFNLGVSDGYVLVGTSINPTTIPTDTMVYVAKISPTGVLVWDYYYGSPTDSYHEAGYAITRMSATGYAIAGVVSNGNASWSKDALFMTINSAGTSPALYAVGVANVDDGAYGITWSSNLDCALVGFTMNNGKTDGMFVNVSAATGGLLGSPRRYGSPSNNDTLFSIENVGSAYLVTGTVGYSSTLKDMWAMQLTTSGGVTWGNTYSFLTSGSSTNNINLGADGQLYGSYYMLMGNTALRADAPPTTYERDIVVTKVNMSDGSPTTTAKYYGATTASGKYSSGYGLRVTGGRILIGGIENFNTLSGPGRFDTYMIRTNTALSSGCNEGNPSVSYNLYNSINYIEMPTPEGRFPTPVSAAWYFPQGESDNQLCYCAVCKRAPSSGADAVEASPMLSVRQVPDANAFQMIVNTDEKVLGLEVFDALGNQITSLAAGTGAADELSWDGVDDRGALVPSGVYFVRLRTDKQVETAQIRIAR
jgi:hypothetical protein